MINLQGDVDRLCEWAVVNAMTINPSKSKAACFYESQGKGPSQLLVNGHVNTENKAL